MNVLAPGDRDRITIAILALGGQGGGVLADWILNLARSNGYVAQGTSVPGVAQRTGSTVYYIEMVRRSGPGANQHAPVLAMMPVPGDVDIVIASELMEAGRGILRGFVSADRTTLIASTHRVYAIAEKSAAGDGRGASERILEAAERRSARFIGFDMEHTASQVGSVISAVMLGALAESEVLPFPAAAFEDAIRHGGKAVATNIRGFTEGCVGARERRIEKEAVIAPPAPTTAAGRAFMTRIDASVPAPARGLAVEGVRRLMDYQDARYAALYLDRLEAVGALDDGHEGYRLTNETARHLALWMAYDDTIRVADLKIRATRRTRIESDIGLGKGQLLTVTEYMHPRLQEFCETLPAAIGGAILRQRWLRSLLESALSRGRHVRTSGLRWFVVLRVVAAMRVFRRSTLRYGHEQDRIEDWLGAVCETARSDSALAAEIVRLQGLIKGYGDTFEQSLRTFCRAFAAARALSGQPDAADRVRAIREVALEDTDGSALDHALVSDGMRAA